MRPKASELLGPQAFVAAAIGEIGPADARELAHHAALLAHTAGMEEGYRSGWEAGRRRAVLLVRAGFWMQVVTLILVAGLWVWR